MAYALVAALCCGVRAAEIAAPSALQVNLGWVPFDIYNTTTPPSQADAGLQASCPSATSVRACYQTAFANFHAQHVKGVRFFFGICGGFMSTPLTNCGQSWTTVTGPKSTWTANVQAFFLDLYNAGIYDIAPTLGHGDLAGVASPPGSSPPVFYQAPAAPPSGNACSNTPPIVQYVPGQPYGNVPCTNTSPYYCPASVYQQGQCGTYCQKSAGHPVDDGYNGYNCSPSNPVFVGWQNIYNVVNALLQAAYNTPTAGSKGIIATGFDVEQELNTVAFPVQARYIVDNAETQTGNADAVNSIRYYMGLYGYDNRAPIWSAAEARSSVAGFNCLSVYQDYARVINLDSIFSAIEGGYIATPFQPAVTDGLYCGGTTSSMYKFPVSHAAPDVADLHTYPCIKPAGSGYCYNDEADAQVQGEATIVYGDVAHFLSLVNPSAIFIVGETHSNSNDGHNETCEFHAPVSPQSAAQLNVAGYNASSLAGHSVVFRPWINLPDASSCFTPGNQYVNQNDAGPYMPSQQ